MGKHFINRKRLCVYIHKMLLNCFPKTTWKKNLNNGYIVIYFHRTSKFLPPLKKLQFFCCVEILQTGHLMRIQFEILIKFFTKFVLFLKIQALMGIIDDEYKFFFYQIQGFQLILGLGDLYFWLMVSISLKFHLKWAPWNVCLILAVLLTACLDLTIRD